MLAFGVYLEVLANVAMLPGESFVRAVVLTWKTEFGTTKVCFDISITVIAVAVSFVLSGTLAGVREGTIIAAHAEGVASCWIHRAKEEFESEEGRQILRDLGIEGDYEGIGHCILGYADGEEPQPKPRKASYVYWAK